MRLLCHLADIVRPPFINTNVSSRWMLFFVLKKKNLVFFFCIDHGSLCIYSHNCPMRFVKFEFCFIDSSGRCVLFVNYVFFSKKNSWVNSWYKDFFYCFEKCKPFFSVKYTILKTSFKAPKTSRLLKLYYIVELDGGFYTFFVLT